ncbi:hypothetical protein M408DRAFT_70263 [Serendipita vermifera MAFF 305830]|uniref:tRNA-dihydrouridine(47) synthase [NAD(P)(+)] n=1 Tax=Serendipita vermifera MAFF 305830 TaxID=933852 RepID=A0A0C3AUI9_SERVB|nr:hypothetical protein M408DRAFT_70263 [Serendipita vermifera MAFF 305830]
MVVPEGPLAGTTRLHSEVEATDVGVDGAAVDDGGEPPAKRVKLSGAQRKALAKERSAVERKEKKGMNKSRRFQKVHDEQDICWRIACGRGCELGEKCKFSHDIPAYLAMKPPDLHIPTGLLTVPPFVEASDAERTPRCPYFDEYGYCRVGFKCRFLGAHLDGEGTSVAVRRNEEKAERVKETVVELNNVSSDLMKRLRKWEFPFTRAKEFAQILKANEGHSMAFAPIGGSSLAPTELPIEDGEEEPSVENGTSKSTSTNQPRIVERLEKRRLHWQGLTYLAPLTTVGNLPFRRLCVDFGADITCGEMGLAHSFLQGSKEEWSLVRRHPSERIFGVQMAGNHPTQTANCAEVIGDECPDLDFVDLNAGCPIDLVYQTGSGSALLNMAGKLGKCLMGMNYALKDVPVTLKMRTGVRDGMPTAHKLMPRLYDWGISSVTLHGRTRQQRYTRLADWSYIQQCVKTLRSGSSGNNGFDPMPFWGNGDCFSGVEYWETVNATGVDGIMIGRGALIKPWLFTEIKERRDWDISSRERLDLIRKYAEFGLCHFGSDTAGINTTRRYLCEALSFLHRYIPIGLLEVLPAKLNDRAPAFRGRDELETLLASADSRTWVKISEMFLGPAPAEWTFVPKHKSNAYGGDEEAQG